MNPEREFFLLAVLGADLPGVALVIAPLEGDAKEDDAHHDDADAGHDDDRPREAVLRFSLAGVRLKFSAVMEASGEPNRSRRRHRRVMDRQAFLRPLRRRPRE